MHEQRVETRLLCSDMINLQWKDKSGHIRRQIGNLEDISLSGACVQLEQPIPLQTAIQIRLPKGELTGKVRYCVFREIGYFLGIEFDPDSRWSQQHYMPQHLLDPRRLVMRTLHRMRPFSPTIN